MGELNDQLSDEFGGHKYGWLRALGIGIIAMAALVALLWLFGLGDDAKAAEVPVWKTAVHGDHTSVTQETAAGDVGIACEGSLAGGALTCFGVVEVPSCRPGSAALLNDGVNVTSVPLHCLKYTDGAMVLSPYSGPPTAMFLAKLVQPPPHRPLSIAVAQHDGSITVGVVHLAGFLEAIDGALKTPPA